MEVLQKQDRHGACVDELSDETIIALANYDWLVNNKSDVELHLTYGAFTDSDGGYEITELATPGFTPAT